MQQKKQATMYTPVYTSQILWSSDAFNQHRRSEPTGQPYNTWRLCTGGLNSDPVRIIRRIDEAVSTIVYINQSGLVNLWATDEKPIRFRWISTYFSLRTKEGGGGSRYLALANNFWRRVRPAEAPGCYPTCCIYKGAKSLRREGFLTHPHIHADKPPPPISS
jgi:hypothetical protein